MGRKKDPCTKYAEDVLAGKIIEGKLMQLAAARHIEDLSRQNTKNFPYYWDVDAANKVIEFANELTVTEGYREKKLKLMPFQCFWNGSVWGWKKKDGNRKYRTAYKEVGRQNGKSMDNGITLAYSAGFTGYRHGQLCCAATKKKQSKIVWNEVKKFIEGDKDLSSFFTIKDHCSQIICNHTGSVIDALSRDTEGIDGMRIYAGSIDEYHAHKTNQIYKLIQDGGGTLPERLISIITTAGFELNSPCYELREYCVQILKRVLYDESLFVAIHTLDPEDDPFDEDVWAKANPYGCSIKHGMEDLRAAAKQAKEMGGFELRNFLTKRVNRWVQKSDNQYIASEHWKACGTNKKLEYMRGKSCYCGLDLSSGGDLTSIALEFPADEDNKAYIWSHSFMPAKRLEEHIKTDVAPYDIWANQGYMTITHTNSGIKNDYKFIVKTLKDIISTYNIKLLGIGYDPHNADGFLDDLETFGIPLTMINQSAKFLNDATQDFALEVQAQNIEYDQDNQLMSWSVVNAKTVKNSFGEIKVDKEPRAKYKRIDVVDAAINAHLLAMKKVQPKDIKVTMNRYKELINKLNNKKN